MSYIYCIKSMCIFLGETFFSKESPSSFKKVNPYWAHSTGSPVKPLQMGTLRLPGSLFSRFLVMLSTRLTQT